jgi:hypothetical protein
MTLHWITQTGFPEYKARSLETIPNHVQFSGQMGARIISFSGNPSFPIPNTNLEMQRQLCQPQVADGE